MEKEAAAAQSPKVEEPTEPEKLGGELPPALRAAADKKKEDSNGESKGSCKACEGAGCKACTKEEAKEASASNGSSNSLSNLRAALQGINA
jgi:hypothetical protein